MYPESTIQAILTAANWLQIGTGVSIEFTYYAGGGANNPSGSTDNMESMVYKKADATTAFTVYFAYDSSDRMIKQWRA